MKNLFLNHCRRLALLLTNSVFIFTVITGDASFAAQQDTGINVPSDIISSLSGLKSAPCLKGLTIDKDNPFHIRFIVDSADSEKVSEEELSRLVKYFTAAIAIPNDEMWVNLSPYERDRIFTEKMSDTDLGVDLLEEDYLLKQISSVLTHPDTELGRTYWNSGTEESFNKIWVVPSKIRVFEKNTSVIITEALLKVMTERDYTASAASGDVTSSHGRIDNGSTAAEILLPEITEQVNEGENFSRLRQIYHSVILADWFKDTLKESVYKYYFNKGSVSGFSVEDTTAAEEIFNRYVETFTKGAYRITKKERSGSRMVKKEYFSGGYDMDPDQVSRELEDSSSNVDFLGGIFVFDTLSRVDDPALQNVLYKIKDADAPGKVFTAVLRYAEDRKNSDNKSFAEVMDIIASELYSKKISDDSALIYLSTYDTLIVRGMDIKKNFLSTLMEVWELMSSMQKEDIEQSVYVSFDELSGVVDLSEYYSGSSALNNNYTKPLDDIRNAATSHDLIMTVEAFFPPDIRQGKRFIKRLDQLRSAVSGPANGSKPILALNTALTTGRQEAISNFHDFIARLSRILSTVFDSETENQYTYTGQSSIKEPDLTDIIVIESEVGTADEWADFDNQATRRVTPSDLLSYAARNNSGAEKVENDLLQQKFEYILSASTYKELLLRFTEYLSASDNAAGSDRVTVRDRLIAVTEANRNTVWHVLVNTFTAIFQPGHRKIDAELLETLLKSFWDKSMVLKATLTAPRALPAVMPVSEHQILPPPLPVKKPTGTVSAKLPPPVPVRVPAAGAAAAGPLVAPPPLPVKDGAVQPIPLVVRKKHAAAQSGTVDSAADNDQIMIRNVTGSNSLQKVKDIFNTWFTSARIHDRSFSMPLYRIKKLLPEVTVAGNGLNNFLALKKIVDALVGMIEARVPLNSGIINDIIEKYMTEKHVPDAVPLTNASSAIGGVGFQNIFIDSSGSVTNLTFDLSNFDKSVFDNFSLVVFNIEEVSREVLMASL